MFKTSCRFVRSKKAFLYLLFAFAVFAPSLAFAPPPLPDPVVPAESPLTEYILGFGVGGYGVWAIWRSRYSSKNKDNFNE